MLIDDTTPDSVVFDPTYSRGFDPDQVDPLIRAEVSSPPSDIPLIPRSEWDARIEEQDREQSSLEHILLRGMPDGSQIMPLDQDGYGYCWSHSMVHAVIADRASRNLPYVKLSAFAVAAKIKGFRDEGGWCGLSAKFAREVGIPADQFWPEKSMARSNDNAETWNNAALHKITEDFADLTVPVWGQNLTFDQVATCLLLNRPCMLDFNWWSHSVCGVRLKRIEAGSYGFRILNSWYVRAGVPWGERGFATLQGNRSIPDGAYCVRSSVPSFT